MSYKFASGDIWQPRDTEAKVWGFPIDRVQANILDLDEHFVFPVCCRHLVGVVELISLLLAMEKKTFLKLGNAVVDWKSFMLKDCDCWLV